MVDSGATRLCEDRNQVLILRESRKPHSAFHVYLVAPRWRASQVPTRDYLTVCCSLSSRMAQRERKSIAHLADKFNTEAPAGYVAGRGRGISGFSKPPPEPKARGKKRDANKEGDEEGGGADDGREGLNGEAADTRELDLGETEKYEKE